MEMEMQFIGEKEFVGIQDGHWEKHWVYQLVRHTISENLNHMRNLEWFSLGQVLGDQIWQFIVSSNEHESARRCVDFMISSGMFPIEIIETAIGDTTGYRVTHN